MRELSLHILDIITNSLEANATRVITCIEELWQKDLLTITIRDNGKGMAEEILAKVTDPFTTSRSTRPVGMGLALWRQIAEGCGGGLQIDSQLGRGTTVKATFRLNHLNRPPLGNISETMLNLIVTTPEVHFLYRHKTEKDLFQFDSYWFYRRMAENDLPMYAFLEEARKIFTEGLSRIGTKA